MVEILAGTPEPTVGDAVGAIDDACTWTGASCLAAALSRRCLALVSRRSVVSGTWAADADVLREVASAQDAQRSAGTANLRVLIAISRTP